MLPGRSGVNRFALIIVPCANLIPSMMVATLGIALPDVRHSLLLSELEAGGLFSVIFAIAAISSGFAGRLADRIGSKTVLVSGLIILAFGFALAGLSPNQQIIFLSLAVTGLGYGFIPTSLYTLMSGVLPQRKGFAASLVSVAYGIGGAGGSLLASRIIATSSWREAFIVVGSIAAVIMALELWGAPHHHQTRYSRHSTKFKESLSRSLILLAVAEFFGGSVFWSTASWTATLLRSAKELSLEDAGWVMGVWNLSHMIGALLLGPLSDRFGRKFVILVSAFPAAVVSLAVYSWLTSPVLLALGFLLFGTLRSSAPTLVVALAQETTSPANAGTAAGTVMSLHYVSAVVAPIVAAHLIVGTNDIVLAMILVSSVPLVLYGLLISAIKETASAKNN